MNLLEEIKNRIVFFDGAMGTRLNFLTGNYQACVDSYNTDEDYRGIVKQAHQEYLNAGADVIQTNTYGANRVKLNRFGLSDRVGEINKEGVKLAREVTPEEKLVAGSVGPLETAAGEEDINRAEMDEIFDEQISALIEAGVDLLVLETFQELEEAESAMTVAAETDQTIIFQIGGVKSGKTGTGTDVRRIAQRVDQLGAEVIGANCRGPYDMLETIEMISEVTSKPISVQSNAGSPEIDRGRMVFSIEPESFRKYTSRWIEAGAVILGGCCGTDPSYIRTIVDTVEEQDLTPTERKPVTTIRVFDEPVSTEDLSDQADNPIAEVMDRDDLLISVEMRPSRKMKMAEYINAAHRLSREGISFFDVPDNAAANVAVDPVVSSVKIQSETRVPVIMHLGASHRNLIATQSLLLGCRHAGIHGILAVTGDHPNVGDHDKYAEHVTDVKSSVDLMELMDQMNQGKLFNESEIEEPTNFFYGGGIAPGRNMTAQVNWLEQKVDAGAQFVFSQPLYSTEQTDELLEKTEHLDIKKFVGILPITSKGNARFFASGSIPGIVLPDDVVTLFENAKDDEEARKLGMEITLELIDEIRDEIDGLYIIPPFGQDKFDQVIKIVRSALREPSATPVS